MGRASRCELDAGRCRAAGVSFRALVASGKMASVVTHATFEGTRRYASRFASITAAGHFRELEGCATPAESAPLVSSLGIGTYQGAADEATDRGYAAAVVAAVLGGINVVDSAINYRFQRSERSIRDALNELARRGFGREEILICTKGGYLTPDGDMPGDPGAYFEREYFGSGILRREDVAGGCHAMSASFLANQLDRSLANLGVSCVDVYYVHNPETQLEEVSREEFLRRLRGAFEFLESAAAAGKIRFYGLATWSGFRQPADAKDGLSLAEIEQVARDVAGRAHRFRLVQMPYNLGMTEALTLANQTVHGLPVTLIEAAQALGITLVASASLSQGKMAQGLPRFIGEALGLENDAQRAIQFARSSPGIITALVGMSRPDHARANAKLAAQPVAAPEQLARLFARGQKG